MKSKYPAIKLCPFCGSKPEILESDEDGVYAGCSKNECVLFENYATVESWNERYKDKTRSALKDVKTIVKQYLIKNGYSGLCTEDCGCEAHDLRPCCEDFSDCKPGYLHESGGIWTTKEEE